MAIHRTMSHSKSNPIGQDNFRCKLVMHDSNSASQSGRVSSSISVASGRSVTQCGKSIPVRGLMPSQRIRPLTIHNLTSAGSFSLQSMRAPGVLQIGHRADLDSVSSKNLPHTAHDAKTGRARSRRKATKECKPCASSHGSSKHDIIVVKPDAASAVSRVHLPTMSRYTSLTTSMYATNDSIGKAEESTSQTVQQHDRRKSGTVSHPSRHARHHSKKDSALGSGRAAATGDESLSEPVSRKSQASNRVMAKKQQQSSLPAGKSCGTQTISRYHPHAHSDSLSSHPEKIALLTSPTRHTTSVLSYAPISMVDTLSHVVIGSQYDETVPCVVSPHSFSNRSAKPSEAATTKCTKGTVAAKATGRDCVPDTSSAKEQSAGHGQDADLYTSALYKPFQSPFDQTLAISALCKHSARTGGAEGVQSGKIKKQDGKASHALTHSEKVSGSELVRMFARPIAGVQSTTKQYALSPLTHTPLFSSRQSVGMSTGNEDDSYDQSTDTETYTECDDSACSTMHDGERADYGSDKAEGREDSEGARIYSTDDSSGGDDVEEDEESDDDDNGEVHVRDSEDVPVATERGGTAVDDEQGTSKRCPPHVKSMQPVHDQGTAASRPSPSNVHHDSLDDGYKLKEAYSVESCDSPKVLRGSFALVASSTPKKPHRAQKSPKRRPVRCIMISKEMYTVSPLVSSSYTNQRNCFARS